MIDRYSGDPALFLTPAGATLKYEAGQPVMDQGLGNSALLALFVDEDWCGNIFLPESARLGSTYERDAKGTITLGKLTDIEDSAARALAHAGFAKVSPEARNPDADALAVDIALGQGQALALTRSGALWQAQAEQGVPR